MGSAAKKSLTLSEIARAAQPLVVEGDWPDAWLVNQFVRAHSADGNQSENTERHEGEEVPETYPSTV